MKNLGFMGYPDYCVNKKGEVFSSERLDRFKRPVLGGRLKGSVRNGYPAVTLCINNKGTIYSVHRLVALAFIPNPLCKKEVNHIDGNRQNNQVNNLEWATRQENQQHAHRTGLQVNKRGKESCSYGKSGKLNPTSKPVAAIVNNQIVATFESASLAAKSTGFMATKISLTASGKRLSCGIYDTSEQNFTRAKYAPLAKLPSHLIRIKWKYL